MDLEGMMLNEISQTEKDKYFMISICEILKTQQISEYNIKEAGLQIQRINQQLPVGMAK